LPIEKIIALCALLALSACSREASIENAIASARKAKLDQVESAGKGQPFFRKGTLDPVWREGEGIVRIPEVPLLNQKGEKRGAADFRGKVTLLGFFYSSCHGFCPVLIKSMQKAEAALAEVKGLRFVGISVDPGYDRPEVLRRYARSYGLSSRWELLTGKPGAVLALARDTFSSQAFRRNTEPSVRNFVHSEHLYLIDAEGRLRGVLNSTRLDLPKEARKAVLALLGPE
jgi:protein SCO1/2